MWWWAALIHLELKTSGNVEPNNSGVSAAVRIIWSIRSCQKYSTIFLRYLLTQRSCLYSLLRCAIRKAFDHPQWWCWLIQKVEVSDNHDGWRIAGNGLKDKRVVSRRRQLRRRHVGENGSWYSMRSGRVREKKKWAVSCATDRLVIILVVDNNLRRCYGHQRW